MLVVVVSVKGSPGVTTLSVALAARWPAPARPVLVEADPSGGDLGIRFSLASTPGVVSLAAAARRTDNPALLWHHTQALPGGLPVVTAPADADRARAALSALADPTDGAGILRAAANTPDSVVIVDCGRVDAGSPAMPIVRSADAMVLLTRAHADDLAHLARRLQSIGRWTAHPAMLLVGEGYSPAEVARELGVQPLGRVPHDPHGAAVLCGRPNTLRWGRSGPAHSALGQVARKVATVLHAEQAPAPAVARQVPAENRPMPLARTVPGVPANPIVPGGLRLAPSPQQPDRQAGAGPDGASGARGGQAS
jgi:hypothetical protein